jgi:DNA-binding beta-propeller fold protein YncE
MVRKIVFIVSVLLFASFRTFAFLSPETLALHPKETSLYIAEATGKKIIAMNLTGMTITHSWALAGAPNGLAISATSDRMVITAGAADGEVSVIDLKTNRVTAHWRTGHSPNAPALSPNGNTLYLCNRFDNEVVIYDLPTKKELGRLPVLREPCAAALTLDGKTLFVANHLPVGPANADSINAAISVIDTDTRAVTGTIQLPNGSTAVKSICLSPDGKFAYITHTLAHYQLPTTQLDRGWMNTSAVTVLNVAAKKILTTFLLDEVNRGAADSWGIAVTADGKWLCVTHAGTHELSVIDRTALHERFDKLAGGQRVSEVSATLADVPNDLSFLVGIRRRIKLSGNGPRGVAVAGDTAYIAEYFTDSIAVVPLNGELRSVALGRQQKMSLERRGEMAFHDATSCFQQWQSCAICHPGGGRVDGLNWDLLNDGIGNPKNVRSLLLAHKTAPSMTFGERQTAEEAIYAGFHHIQFSVVSSETFDEVRAYIRSLKPLPSPALVRGNLSNAAKRGRKIFHQRGCAECHPSPLFTNRKFYNIGTTILMDTGNPVKTPTLVECWRTAPYLHDGSAATLREVFTRNNPKDPHNQKLKLTERELNDLIEYVRSL